MRFPLILAFLLLVAAPVAATPLQITSGMIIYDSQVGFARVVWAGDLTLSAFLRDPGPDLFCQICDAGGVARSSAFLSFGEAQSGLGSLHGGIVSAELTATWLIPRSSGEVTTPFQLNGTLMIGTEPQALLGHGFATTSWLYDSVGDQSLHHAVTYTFGDGLSGAIGSGSTIPEPATGLLLASGLLALLAWRGKRTWMAEVPS